MNTLTFYRNPVNKIGAPIFSDLRIYDEQKHLQGALLNVVYKGNVIGGVEIKAFVCFFFEGERCINETTAWLSFAKPLPEVKKILTQFYPGIQPNTKMAFLTLKWVDRNIKMQEALLKDWWEEQRSQYMPKPQIDIDFTK